MEILQLFPLAALEDILGIAIGGLIVAGIPIVAIFTAHQRKMAEIVRQQPQVDGRVAQQIDLLQAQINELKALVQEHIIRTDGPVGLATAQPPSIEDRLKQS